MGKKAGAAPIGGGRNLSPLPFLHHLPLFLYHLPPGAAPIGGGCSLFLSLFRHHLLHHLVPSSIISLLLTTHHFSSIIPPPPSPLSSSSITSLLLPFTFILIFLVFSHLHCPLPPLPFPHHTALTPVSSRGIGTGLHTCFFSCSNPELNLSLGCPPGFVFMTTCHSSLTLAHGLFTEPLITCCIPWLT